MRPDNRPSLAHPSAMLTGHATLKAKILGNGTSYLAAVLPWTPTPCPSRKRPFRRRSGRRLTEADFPHCHVRESRLFISVSRRARRAELRDRPTRGGTDGRRCQDDEAGRGNLARLATGRRRSPPSATSILRRGLCRLSAISHVSTLRAQDEASRTRDVSGKGGREGRTGGAGRWRAARGPALAMREGPVVGCARGTDAARIATMPSTARGRRHHPFRLAAAERLAALLEKMAAQLRRDLLSRSAGSGHRVAAAGFASQQLKLSPRRPEGGRGCWPLSPYAPRRRAAEPLSVSRSAAEPPIRPSSTHRTPTPRSCCR